MAALTFRRTRRVWAALTEHPDATYRELAAQTRLSLSVVRAAVQRLERAGYVEADPVVARGRRVLVPLYEQNSYFG
jgi:DNA-binding MarR family transcriptional regulator